MLANEIRSRQGGDGIYNCLLIREAVEPGMFRRLRATCLLYVSADRYVFLKMKRLIMSTCKANLITFETINVI